MPEPLRWAPVNQGRPRLLYVVTLAEVGGAQSYVRDLMSAMGDEFEVAVAAHGDGPLRAAAADLGVPFFPLHNVRRALSPLHDPLGLIELVRLFRRLRPDIVHLNSSKAGVLGRLAGALARVPVRIFTAHGWAFKATTGTGARLYLVADRLVRPLTTMVVCVSETERRAGLAARVCTVDNSTVIANAVEVGELARDVTGHDPRAPLIVSVGRLAEPKDFSTLVSALSRLDAGTTRLRILGDGPLREALAAQIEGLGLDGSVELAGEVTDVGRHLDEADVFVLSSRSEGMPISVLEAMSAGLPVVATDVGGLSEVVVDGTTGFLVPAGDADALASRLHALIVDPDLRTRFGDSGHSRARDLFSLPGWRERHRQLYRSLLLSRAPDRARRPLRTGAGE
jgi:glycosyltransferase involved in cell wall biosynthesis